MTVVRRYLKVFRPKYFIQERYYRVDSKKQTDHILSSSKGRTTDFESVNRWFEPTTESHTRSYYAKKEM